MRLLPFAVALTLLALTLLCGGGCAPAGPASVGTRCEINSDCAAPLVCRLSYCRNECATSADCATGSSCVLDAAKLGACQLAAETRCVNQSDCPEGLVCRFTQCTNACTEDRDCLGGARCEPSPMGNACVDRSTQPCTLDSECDVSGVAGQRERCIAGRCRQECFSDRDCRNDFWCNDAINGTCWPPPRPARPDGGVGVDGGDADGGSAGVFPTTPLWRESRAGAFTYVAALVGDQLVFSSLDVITGAGGSLHVLDTTTRGWRELPFAQARLRMSWVVSGSVVYITGGSYSIPGGDPLTDIVRFDPATDTLSLLGASASEPRESSRMLVCGDLLIVAGGNPNNFTGTGSAAVDLIDLSASPAVASADTLPAPMRGLGAVVDGARALFVGGRRDLMLGNDYATNDVRVFDCDTRTWTMSTMPHYYSEMEGAVLGTSAYFVGSQLPNGTDIIASADISAGLVEVLDLSSATWSALTPPSVPDARAVNLAVSPRFLFRSADDTMQALELATGVWTSWTVDFQIEQLASDGTTLFVIGKTLPSTALLVEAYSIP